MWVTHSHDGGLDVAATDVYSGIKAQYVDSDGLRMRGYLS